MQSRLPVWVQNWSPLTYYLILQCRAVVVSWALSNGNLSLLLCCKGLVSATLNWSVPPSSINFSMFTPVKGMPRPLCARGCFSGLHSQAALSFCGELVALSHCFKVVLQSSFLFSAFSLAVWRVFPPCSAFLSLQLHCCLPSWDTLAVTVKVEKQLGDLPPNPPKRKKRDILWKFFQQKQRLWMFQTPALDAPWKSSMWVYTELTPQVYIYVNTSLYLKEVCSHSTVCLDSQLLH